MTKRGKHVTARNSVVAATALGLVLIGAWVGFVADSATPEVRAVP